MLDDDYESQEAPERSGRVVSTLLHPSTAPDGRSWAEYMRAVRAETAAAPPPDPGGQVTVLEWAESIEASDLPSSALAIWKAAEALGFELQAHRSASHTAPVLFLQASEEGAENPHQAGDVRFSDHSDRHYVIGGRRGGKQAFLARWSGRDLEGTGASFEGATIRDADGVPAIIETDYSLDANLIKELGITKAEAEARATRLASEYNGDEVTYLDRYFTKATPFKEWLASKGDKNDDAG